MRDHRDRHQLQPTVQEAETGKNLMHMSDLRTKRLALFVKGDSGLLILVEADARSLPCQVQDTVPSVEVLRSVALVSTPCSTPGSNLAQFANIWVAVTISGDLCSRTRFPSFRMDSKSICSCAFPQEGGRYGPRQTCLGIQRQELTEGHS